MRDLHKEACDQGALLLESGGLKRSMMRESCCCTLCADISEWSFTKWSLHHGRLVVVLEGVVHVVITAPLYLSASLLYEASSFPVMKPSTVGDGEEEQQSCRSGLSTEP